jgi:hypothetical protein
MKPVAWVGGVVVFAGLVVLAVAGFPGAIPILVSAAALVAMIGLGGAMGGRHTANVAPVAGPHATVDPSASGVASDGPPQADGPVPSDPVATADAGEGAESGDGGTMTR